MPCNFHLRRLAEKVKEGIRAAGGTPMEFNTVAVSDGITMGTEGMRASLVSREVIADSIELMARGYMFDGVIALSGCDKTIPGCVMALARLDVPSLMLYGGSIMPGHWRGKDVTIQEVFEAVGAHAAGDMSDEDLSDLEHHASPGAGACGGQFTANTMATAFEMLGISAMGSGMVPAEDGKKGKVAEECGRLVVDLVEKDLTPSRIITKESLENAIGCVAMTGGSTNAVLHLLAVANDAGVDLTIDDFDRISWRTPLLADLKPFGRFVAPDMFRAGGVRVVANRLREAGLLNEDAITVTGTTIGEEADAAEEAEGQEVIRPLVRPAQAERRPRDPARQPRARRLRREALGPRPASSTAARRACSSPRRSAFAAVEAQQIQAERRRRDPQRGPVGRPGHARDARRHRRDRRPGAGRLGRAADRRPLLGRDARLHGRPRGARRRRAAARSPPSATATPSSSTCRTASCASSCPTTRSRSAWPTTSRRRRSTRTACSASTRSTSARRPKAPSRPRPRLPAPRGRSPRRRRGPRSAPRAAR